MIRDSSQINKTCILFGDHIGSDERDEGLTPPMCVRSLRSFMARQDEEI